METKQGERLSRMKKALKQAVGGSHFEWLENRQMMSSTLPLPAPVGSAKLTGALIGTAGSYLNQGSTIAK